MSHVGEAAIVPRMAGLTVEQAMTRVGEPPCPKCHRAVLDCICRSHVRSMGAGLSVDELRDQVPRAGRFTAEHKRKVIASVVEMYYEHDIAGIVRALEHTLS